ncbi:hypothetical protein HRI_004539000 [Hibiscus trionum]|uniref:Uncharacterized protein n=1 Tax=Hibiscus trionum TaxID=183268 RepID=A0A9W7J9B4_HIBTR|nr:hypothetical protein HRI_004539000 [Hibiscus trionum]
MVSSATRNRFMMETMVKSRLWKSLMTGDDEMKVENRDCEVKTEGFSLSNGGGKRRVKSVPRNPKKLWMRGIKVMVEKKKKKMQVVEMNEEFWKEVENGGFIKGDEMEFFEGDTNIFVGTKDIC